MPGCVRGNKVGGVGAEARCRPGFAGRRRRCVGTGEAVAQHDLRHAEAIDHRHRRLIAALAAFAERRAGEIEREFRTERFVCHKRVLRAHRRGKRERNRKR